MKKCILLCSILACLAMIGYNVFPNSVRIASEEIRTESDEFQYTNNTQFIADVWMGSYQQELYFYPQCKTSTNKSAYDGWLCVLRDQEVEKLHRLDDGSRIVGCANGFVYYISFGNNGKDDKLLCYDMNQKKESVLYAGELSYLYTGSVSADGTLLIPFFAEKTDEVPKYLRVSCGEITDSIDHTEGYPLNQKEYVIEGNRNDLEERILATDEQGNAEELQLGHAESRALIPVKDNILIHNQGYNAMLYRVDDSGNVTSLFDLPCLSSYSAVAVAENSAYLSVKRYEKFGSKGMLRFENDAEEGTYRIDLDDFSVEKVSDQIYNGLYYFGGEYLYACDEYCNVYILDLQGNVLKTIVEILA